MKKIFLSIVTATAIFFTAGSVSAQVYEEGATQQTPRQQQEEMQQIEIQELPQEVQQAVERDFQGATISEAFVKEKDGERKYRLMLTTREGETRELYADAQGNWIDKEDKDQE